MSICNLGLQAVGLIRENCQGATEMKLKSCHFMKDVRKLAERDSDIKGEVKECVEPVKGFLNYTFETLELKNKAFKVLPAASGDQVQHLLENIKRIDANLNINDTAKKIGKKLNLTDFLKTHCAEKTYMFYVKKCDDISSHICKPPRLPKEIFQTLKHLPDPILDGDHYKTFNDLYGLITSEQYRPSIGNKRVKSHGLDFNPSTQTAKNTQIQVSH